MDYADRWLNSQEGKFGAFIESEGARLLNRSHQQARQSWIWLR